AIGINQRTDTVFVTNEGSGQITLIDAKTNTVSGTVYLGDFPQGMTIDEANNQAFVQTPWLRSPAGVFTPPQLVVIDGATRKVSRRIALGQTRRLSVDAGLNALYLGSDTTIDVRDARTFAVTRTITGFGTSNFGMVVDPTSHDLYVERADGSFAVIDPMTGALIDTIAGTANDRGGFGLAFDSATHRLYVSSALHDPVTIIDTQQRTVLTEVSLGSSGPAGAIAVDRATHIAYAASSTKRTLSEISPQDDSVRRVTQTVVSSPGPAVAGSTTTIRAVVGPLPDGGTVAFSIDGLPVAACRARPVDAVRGSAICSTASPTKAGAHAVAATYSGDARFRKSTGAGSLPVVPGAATRLEPFDRRAQYSPPGAGFRPIVVITTDAYGNPVNGVDVRYELVSGAVAVPYGATTRSEIGGFAYGPALIGSKFGPLIISATIVGQPGSKLEFTEYVQAAAGLGVKVLTPYTFAPGKQTVIRVVAYNDGPSDASPVLAAVQLPPELTVLSAPGGYRDGNIIYYAGLTVVARTAAWATIMVSVSGAARGTLTIAAAVGSATTDPDSTDNVTYASAAVV
ncbi:MAG: beta-propeller, partial [Pseudonocardiales bacterium]|nr:beta-propeller [Pseudonocardiales bacterium]